MKKFLALVLAMLMVFSLCACGNGGDSGEKVVKIGVFEPLTGDSAAGGKQEVLGMQYANSKVPTVEIGGETYKVELVYSDNGSDSAKAVSAASKLVNEKVSLVLGSYGSGVSIAAGTYFANAKIPAIGCSCTNPAVTEANPYYFRVCFLDPFQGSVMANFAKDEFSAANAYVLSMLGEDYGSGLATYFVNAFEDLGGTVTSEQFPEGTSDFSAYIQNAINAGADVIFAPCATTYAAQIITQAASAGFDKPITAGDTWESSVILDAQKGTSVQVYCSTFFDENDDSGAAKEFVTGFKEWLNADSQKLTNNGGTLPPKPGDNKPDDTNKDNDKKEDTEPVAPVVKRYDLTVKNAEVTVKDADGKAVEFTKAEDGTLTAKVPENAEVTVKYTAPTDAIVFDLWSINSDAKLDVNVKENPLTFRMPAQAVTIEAMTQDATIESEGPGVLGTAAMIGVAGAGTAVLGYTGYMIGTELYLNTVLPAGAAIPQNTTELAKLLWTEAGKPAPAAVMAEDATDEQKALTWAVESQLISADKPADASVGRWEVIRGWNRVKEMK